MFLYDVEGNPYAIEFTASGNTTAVRYYYAVSSQGDVIGIVDASNDLVARYAYDAWGKLLGVFDADGAVITDTNHIAHVNPLRYRSYIYDTETGLYYCSTRYYDPQTRRFINDDGYVSTGQDYLGFNMYAYCLNNPVNYYDPTGNLSLLPGMKNSSVYANCNVKIKPVSKVTKYKKSSNASLSPELEPKSSYQDYLDALGERESSNNYTATNSYGYLGRYQMGGPALQDAGFQDSSGDWTDLAASYGVNSPETFLNSPEAQDFAITAYNMKVCGYIQHYGLDSYIGTQYCGVTVTCSGLLAACHLVGIGNMIYALTTGAIVWDGNGVTADTYMKEFEGYNISEVW